MFWIAQDTFTEMINSFSNSFARKKKNIKRSNIVKKNSNFTEPQAL